MDTEKLHTAIMTHQDWGNKLSENDSFYRLLFRLDKVRESNETLSTENVKWLFASYKKWFVKAQKMLEDCNDDNLGNQEAVTYGEQLKYDILQHVHSIITESKLEEADLINKLTIIADMETARIEREAIENKQMQQ